MYIHVINFYTFSVFFRIYYIIDICVYANIVHARHIAADVRSNIRLIKRIRFKVVM